MSSRPGLAEGLLAEGALPAPALCGLGPASSGFEPATAYLVQVEQRGPNPHPNNNNNYYYYYYDYYLVQVQQCGEQLACEALRLLGLELG